MIPSLLQIPSAVSDSKLHSVLPNNGKGDFTFDRSTGATRINKDGLIEEVGYFSSELVQNGNFSELGSELVTNGDFSNGTTGWTANSCTLSVVDNTLKVTSTAGFGNAEQNITVVSGKTYRVSADFIYGGSVEGRLNAYDGSASPMEVAASDDASLSFYITISAGQTNLRIRTVNQSSSTGVYNNWDNVSVKQVDPNDRWSLGTNVEYGNSFIKMNNSAALAGAQQTNVITSGVQCRVTFTVQNYVSGTVNLRHPLSQDVTANGTYVFEGAANSTKVLIRGNAVTNNFEVTNISVVEVQGDRPRLSYDITNGVVEDKPHLLLEPSSTNSITFSNDLSQSVYTGDGFGNAVYGQVGVNGTNDAWLFTKSGASNSDIYNTAFTGTYTFSFFVKKEANKGVKIYNFGDTTQNSTINIETGAYVAGVNTVTIQEFPNDWLRVAQTLTISNGKYYLYVTDGTSTQIASSIVVQYFQIEQQAFPTTYIPTAGTTITRAAETCNNSKPSVNSTEGVLYAEVAALANDGNLRMININDGTQNNRAGLQYSSSNNVITAAYDISGAGQATLNHTLSSVTSFNKIAFKYKVNDFALYVNGSEVATDTSGSVLSANTLNNIDFEYGDNRFFFYGKVKGLAVYNEALTDAQLIQLTS